MNYSLKRLTDSLGPIDYPALAEINSRGGRLTDGKLELIRECSLEPGVVNRVGYVITALRKETAA